MTSKVRADCLWTKTIHIEKITGYIDSQAAGSHHGCEQSDLLVGREGTRGQKSVYVTVMLLWGYLGCFSFFLCRRDWNFLLCSGSGEEELQHHHRQPEGCALLSHRHQQDCRLGCASGLPHWHRAPGSNGMWPSKRQELQGKDLFSNALPMVLGPCVCVQKCVIQLLFCSSTLMLLVRWNRPNVGLMKTAGFWVFWTWKLSFKKKITCAF